MSDYDPRRLARLVPRDPTDPPAEEEPTSRYDHLRPGGADPDRDPDPQDPRGLAALIPREETM